MGDKDKEGNSACHGVNVIPGPEKGQNLGWHLVVTFAHHSQLRPLRWSNSEILSQSLFLLTFPINIAVVSG